MLFAGIDSGSFSTKVVLIENHHIRSYVVRPMGWESARDAAEQGLEEAIISVGKSKDDIRGIAITGRGKKLLPTTHFQSAAESMCLARGAKQLFPLAHTALDIGAQGCLAVRFSERGVLSSAFNDKCASNTGVYLEMVSQIFQMSVAEMGQIKLNSTQSVAINSTCAVFAESEIVSLIGSGVKRDDILAAVYRAIGARLYAVLLQACVEKDVVLTGGVALDGNLRRVMEKNLGYGIGVPENPFIINALGAAVICAERYV